MISIIIITILAYFLRMLWATILYILRIINHCYSFAVFQVDLGKHVIVDTWSSKHKLSYTKDLMLSWGQSLRATPVVWSSHPCINCLVVCWSIVPEAKFVAYATSVMLLLHACRVYERENVKYATLLEGTTGRSNNYIYFGLSSCQWI